MLTHLSVPLYHQITDFHIIFSDRKKGEWACSVDDLSKEKGAETDFLAAHKAPEHSEGISDSASGGPGGSFKESRPFLTFLPRKRLNCEKIYLRWEICPFWHLNLPAFLRSLSSADMISTCCGSQSSSWRWYWLACKKRPVFDGWDWGSAMHLL